MARNSVPDTGGDARGAGCLIIAIPSNSQRQTDKNARCLRAYVAVLVTQSAIGQSSAATSPPLARVVRRARQIHLQGHALINGPLLKTL